MEACKVFVLAAVIQLSSGAPVSAASLDYVPGRTYKYSYTSQTSLNEPRDARAASRAQQDVGFKFSGTAEITPVWQKGSQALVKLEVTNPQLISVAREQLSRELKGLPRLPVFFQWDGGRVGQVYSAEDDATLAVNIKKGVISLFQMQLESKHQSEVDTSGECSTVYQRVDDTTITKTKEGCQSSDLAGTFTNINPLLSASVTASSVTTYQLKDDILLSARAQESFLSRLNMQTELATQIAVSQGLVYKSTTRGTQVQGGSLDEVIKVIQTQSGQLYHGTSLETMFEVRQCTKPSTTFPELVTDLRNQLQSEMAAKTETAATFLQLVELCRDSPKQQLLQALQDDSNTDIVPVLVDILSACQTSASLQTLMEVLNFQEDYYIEVPERFLLGTAFTTHPSPELLTTLWDLYKQEVPSEKLRESIGEALGALVHTYCGIQGQCQHKLVRDISGSLVEHLEACQDNPCRPPHIRALANAGLPDTIPILLKYAVESKDASVAEAAVKALRRMGDHNLARPEVREAMKKIFHQRQQGYDTAVRSKALATLIATGLSQTELHDIIAESSDPWNTEYDSYIQARLYNMAQQDPKVRAMMSEVMKNSNISNYHILAPKGKSLAFTSPMAETRDLTAEYFMYVENSRAGILKRSGMDVTASSPAQTLPLYSFGMYAAGLEGLLGDDPEPGQEDLEATAGLALDLLGVSLRPISFFTGQSGLMSAVWNAPSEPVSAMQANLLLQDHAERRHLGNGLIVEHSLQGAISIDMSGSLSISLWNKNAKSLIKNSAAMVMTGKTSIVTSSFRTGVEFAASSVSCIDFQSDVDFYDGIKTCLQMGRPQSTFRNNVTKYEHARGFKKNYIARVRRSHPVHDLSYPLPPRNSEECRKLMAANS